MIKVERILNNLLNDRFPLSDLESIKLNNRDNVNNYFSGVLSQYNHFLTEEDASDKIISYFDINLKDKEMFNKYKKIESKIILFFNKIFNEYDVFYFNIENKLDFYTFESIEEFEGNCIKSIKEEKFLQILIPELDSIILGSFDFNFIVFTKVKENLKTMEIIAKKVKLYFIV